ncbi:MAG: tetratricopeptide repeat protein, partial [Clostridia bacterium]|nr:tetratricopeptide repeat protein [Clostridia bacterium]
SAYQAVGGRCKKKSLSETNSNQRQEQKYKNSVNFLGRDEIVKEIFGYMDNPDSSAVTVKGPAGIGKTEICKAVYWKLKDKNPDFSMPFVDLAGLSAADVIPSIAKALGGFREDVSQESLLDMLHSFLKGNNETFVYLDNFEAVWNDLEQEKKNDLADCLKRLTDAGLKLLISSQVIFSFGDTVEVHELDSNKDIKTMSFDKLAETDGGKLFLKTLGRKLKSHEQDSFISLIREMGGHPLSIVLTATYSRNCSSIDNVKDIWSEISSHIAGEPDTHDSIRCALEPAWRQVRKSKAAVFIWALHTYSVYPLDSNMIWELNKNSVRKFHKKELTDGENMLYRYGLIDMTDDKKANMLLCIKKNLENLDETGDFKSEIESAFLTWITWCGTLLKLGNDRKNKEHDKHWNRALEWLPECFSLAEYCLDKQKYDELRILLDDAHNYYQFDVVRSVPLLTRLTQEVPEDFPLQSSWYKYLGDILSLTGKQEEALQAYDEAERLARQEHDDLGLANVLQSRGDLLRRTGNLEGALQAYNEAERLARQEHDDLGLA